MIPNVCMNPCTVRVASRWYEPVELDAWDIGVPGLVIAVRVGPRFQGHPRYSLTHRATGYAICNRAGVDTFDNLEDAVAALDFLSGQPADWTHPDPQEDPAAFKAASQALRQYCTTTTKDLR